MAERSRQSFALQPLGGHLKTGQRNQARQPTAAAGGNGKLLEFTAPSAILFAPGRRIWLRRDATRAPPLDCDQSKTPHASASVGSTRPPFDLRVHHLGKRFQEPIIILDRSTTLRRSLETALTHLGLFAKLHIVAEMPRVHLAVDAVRAGMGVAIVPTGPEYGKLIMGLQELKPPKGLPGIRLAIMYRNDRYVPRYMRAFIEIAERVMKGVRGPS